MGDIQFANKATSLLAAPALAADLSITVDDASEFPPITGPESFYVVLEPLDLSIYEVCKVTDVVGNVLTVERGQGGTSAQDFAVGDRCDNRLTKTALDEFLQKSSDPISVGAIGEVQVSDGAGGFTSDPGFIYDGVNLASPEIVAGNPGTESTGIVVNGTFFDSVLKASDIGPANVAQFILHKHATAIAPIIVGARTNSDDATHVPVINGQGLLYIYGVGWDGVDYKIGAQITMEVDGTPVVGSMPTRMSFLTTPVGAITPVERMRITPSGDVQIANDLDISGYIAGYAGAPLDGQVLKWVTANGRAEFAPVGAGDLPLGGVEFDLLIKQSAVDGDAAWVGSLDGGYY